MYMVKIHMHECIDMNLKISSRIFFFLSRKSRHGLAYMTHAAKHLPVQIAH